MIRREVIFGFFLVLFSISFIGASSIGTEFGIDGCQVGALTLFPGNCEQGYYCGDGGRLVDVRESGCAGDLSGCCGQGYVCNAEEECKRSTLDCTTFMNQSGCIASHPDGVCFWIDVGAGGYCTENFIEGSCSVYVGSSSCTRDEYNLGSIGEGTEVCGTVNRTTGMTIMQNSCECVWDPSDNCSLSYTTVDTFYAGTPNSFDCSKSFTTGECINGKQNISWTASVSFFQGYTSVAAIPSADIQGANCVDGSRERVCGQATVRLPGFGGFALMSTIGILLMFYIFKIKREGE